MTATDLLSELRQRGVELRPDGERLLYRPREAVTPELLAAIREHKPELLALLSRGGEPEPSRWSRLADSGLHHNDVVDHAEVIFLFAHELIFDPTKAREDCRTLPRTWGHYAPFWKERLPREAFEELERRYRRRLAALSTPGGSIPSQAPKALRPLVLNAEGSGCAECGGGDYWVAKGGDRFCLACHPAYFKDAIAIGTIKRAEENLRRPSSRRGRG